MKKKKDANKGDAPAKSSTPKQPKQKKKEEAPRYRDWEKERRDRLNVAFNKLATTVCEDSPPVKKIDIIIKACECIDGLRSEVEELKKESGVDNKILENEAQKFTKQLEELQKRIERLVNMLQEVGCEKPTWVNLPSTTPAPPDLGKRPLHYSNKLDPAKVKELLRLPKKTIAKRLQNSRRRKKKVEAAIRKRITVPKVPCTMLNQLPPGILLFKGCPPENTPKVLIVPPPQTPAVTPLILLPPPLPPKQHILTMKPPPGKVSISSVKKNERVKKIKKALAVQNSKGIRHSIDALCKKGKDAATQPPKTGANVSVNKENNVIPSQTSEIKEVPAAVAKPVEPTVAPAQLSNFGAEKENLMVPIPNPAPLIRPASPKTTAQPITVSNPVQSVVATPPAPPKETFSVPQMKPVPTPVVQREPTMMPLPDTSIPKSTQDMQLTPIFSSSGAQEKCPQPVFSHTSQAPSINFSDSYTNFSSTRSYDTQTTFSHLGNTQTPHLYPSLYSTGLSKETEQPNFNRAKSSGQFSHNAPVQPNSGAVVVSSAAQAPASQADTFTHLRTNILPTFSTFGDLSHCNQQFGSSGHQHQEKPNQGHFTEIFTHVQQKQNNFQQQPAKSTPVTFSQGYPTKTQTAQPTFSHEKPAQVPMQHQQQTMVSTQPKPPQFSTNRQPQQQQTQPPPPQQQNNNQERSFFYDVNRPTEFGSADASFIGPQPPMATVVEPATKEQTLYNPFRTEDMVETQRGEALNASTFSNDIFASLHVPSGHSESVSPTAAFLHTFPLVSAGRNTHEEATGERVEGSAGNLLQLGTLEENNQPGSVMELSGLMPTLEDKNKRSKGYSDVLLQHSYQIESEYDAEISSIMSSGKQRQQSKPHQEERPVFHQQDYGAAKNKQSSYDYYQQAAYKKRTVGAAQKPPPKETRPREQAQASNQQSYPVYSASNYQPVSSMEPSSSVSSLPVSSINPNPPINNFMLWNNSETQQPQRVQQNYSCRQSVPQPQQQPQQQQQQKEVQRPPVNWMTNDVRPEESAVNLFDIDWNKQSILPTLVGDLALGPNPPTPRKKDGSCKYTSGQNFLSVSQLVENNVPKEKAKRRLANKAGNVAKRVERGQKQNQQPCIDYHNVNNWPAPKPVCKTVPSNYSAEALIGTPQHDQTDKTDNNRYNQRFTRNYHSGEQNYFPPEQQVDYHQTQYDCSSMYQPNTSFASIVTSSGSTNSIVPSFNQDLNLFASTPQRPDQTKSTNNKRRADNFHSYPDCNRPARVSGPQQYQQQGRPNQQLVPQSAVSGSSLTNFNLSTIFPEINKPVIAPPIPSYIPSKNQGSSSDYVIPPPPNVPFNTLLAPPTPQVSFPAPSFTMPPALQFPVQLDN